jgi:hypothetical protein
MIVGYRQLEINQLEIKKAAVARFEWTMLDAKRAAIAHGECLVIGAGAAVSGWKAGLEYWYVTSASPTAPAEHVAIECVEVIGGADAAAALSKYSAAQAFVATMVPQPQRLLAGDPVLAQATVQGYFGATGSTLDGAAALWLELDGRRIKRLDWYWDGAAPLSLFPGGAKVGDRVELKQVRNGTAGFPQVGWNKCQQVGPDVR